MRLNEKNAESLSIANLLETELVYHEMEDTPILEVDSLSQLRANLQVLTDLTARLSFLNRELRYMMKVD